MIRHSELNGFTRVAMLGRIGVRSRGDVFDAMYRSVKMYWLTNSGSTSVPFSPLRRKETPLNMPSPSNQCASRPNSSFVTGLPPLRTYCPPSSSFGISPVYMQGVRGCMRWTGAKLPDRYLDREIRLAGRTDSKARERTDAYGHFVSSRLWPQTSLPGCCLDVKKL